MFKRNRMRLLWLLCMMAPAGLAVTAASAQPATHNLTIGQTAIGHLQPDGPGVETWAFEGVAGRVVSVTVSSSLFEPTLQLVSPTGAELGREEEGRHERCCHPMRVVALLPADGRYLVRVATDWRTQGGAYELTVHAPTVTPLELNTPATRLYENARGADVWSFHGKAGQVVRFSARSGGGGDDFFDPWVQLTSPHGERLGRDADPVLWPLTDQLVAFLPVDGLYLVEVSDAFLSASGTYRITADTVTPAPLGEIEPGGAVLRVDRPVEDVWSFGATAGQVVEVDVAVTADAFSGHYHLISPTGKVIRTSRRRQTIPLPLDGRYLLSMTDGVRADVSEVSVRPVPVTPLADMPGVGVLGAGHGADVWGFDGVAGQVVGVRVAREGRSYLEREIISPTGELLARLPLGGRDWEERSKHMVLTLPVDGRYLVRLSSLSRESVPYDLSVRVLRAAGSLAWGRPVAGFFSGDGPRIGIWEFDGSAGRVANMRASCAFRCRLLLVSPFGAAVASSRPRPRSELTELFAVSGRYRVVLTADDEAVGAYEVRVDSSAVTPRPLEMNGPAVVDERDMKLWSFQGAAARVVRVTAYPSTTFMAFDVISPAGEMVAMNDGQMVVRLPLDGRYLVRVRYVDGDYTGDYGVAVSSVPETVEVRGTLRMNTPARGVLDQHGSGIGVWAFEGTAGQSVSVVVVTGRDWVVQLLSPTGEELGWASSPRLGGLPLEARLEARLPVTGRYLVRVLAHNDFWTTPNRMRYEIEVRPGQAAPGLASAVVLVAPPRWRRLLRQRGARRAHVHTPARYFGRGSACRASVGGTTPNRAGYGVGVRLAMLPR